MSHTICAQNVLRADNLRVRLTLLRFEVFENHLSEIRKSHPSAESAHSVNLDGIALRVLKHVLVRGHLKQRGDDRTLDGDPRRGHRVQEHGLDGALVQCHLSTGVLSVPRTEWRQHWVNERKMASVLKGL